MVTTVTLQPPFEFYWWVILIAAVLMTVAVTLLFFALKRFVVKKPVLANGAKPAYKFPQPAALRDIKDRYLQQLQGLLKAYTDGEFEKREGYQRLSLLIRGFVREATGINVENFTKSEIASFGLRNLNELMEEYYVPEFAEEERAKDKNFGNSCNVAMGVIKRWK